MDNSALVRSFEKIFCTLEDLKIDCPHAERVVLEIIQGCIEAPAIEFEQETSPKDESRRVASSRSCSRSCRRGCQGLPRAQS